MVFNLFTMVICYQLTTVECLLCNLWHYPNHWLIKDFYVLGLQDHICLKFCSNSCVVKFENVKFKNGLELITLKN